MIRRPPRSTQSRSSAASDVYKRRLPRRARVHRPGLLAVQVTEAREQAALRTARLPCGYALPRRCPQRGRDPRLVRLRACARSASHSRTCRLQSHRNRRRAWAAERGQVPLEALVWIPELVRLEALVWIPEPERLWQLSLIHISE